MFVLVLALQPSPVDLCHDAIRKADAHGNSHGPTSATKPKNRDEYLNRARVLQRVVADCGVVLDSETEGWSGGFERKARAHVAYAEAKLDEMRPMICRKRAFSEFEHKQYFFLLLETDICANRKNPRPKPRSKSNPRPGGISRSTFRVSKRAYVSRQSENALRLTTSNSAFSSIFFLETTFGIVTYNETTGLDQLDNTVLDVASTYAAVRDSTPDLSAAFTDGKELSNAVGLVTALSAETDEQQQKKLVDALATAAPEQMLDASKLAQSTGITPPSVVLDAVEDAREHKRNPEQRVKDLVAAAQADDPLAVSQFWNQVEEVCSAQCQLEYSTPSGLSTVIFDKVSNVSGTQATLLAPEGATPTVRLRDIESVTLSPAKR